MPLRSQVCVFEICRVLRSAAQLQLARPASRSLWHWLALTAVSQLTSRYSPYATHQFNTPASPMRAGQVLSFAGEGMPRAADPTTRGNLHVRLNIVFPESLAFLSPEQREALRRVLSG